ncbi:MAG: VOC family protein [Litoricolaceae bacterium]|nr:VOC family protein [Litorivicinaceae bacterium]
MTHGAYMSMRTNRITLLVDEIESAISFYTHGFGLQLMEDTQISESKRIVRLGCTATDVSFNLTTPKPGDEELVGRQAGQRVFIFLDTKDLDQDLQRFKQHGIAIHDGPRTEPFGRCLLVKDVAGNLWEFVERS